MAAPGRTADEGVAALLADGTRILVRPLVAGDRDALRALHARASDDSIYKRFFSGNRSAAQSFVDRICTPTPTTQSLVALRRGDVVGVSTTIDVPGDAAEVALLVEESLHGVGIGSVLLERAAYDARARGVRRFTAEVLAENGGMIRVFHGLGFGLVEQRDHEVLSLSLDLTLDVTAIEAADGRHRHARAASLRPMFEPHSVAVVGVSRRRGGVGREVVENLLAGGFAGEVFAVGRPGLTVRGVACVPAVSELPEGLDLVMVAVPRGEVEETVRQLAERGARTCVVLTAGLAETGAGGATVERRVAAVARGHDMRLVGPNCFGLLSNLRATRLDATFGDVRPDPGTLAVGSQSGGVGVALLGAARARGLGVAAFVSLGNKADVSGNDLLSVWHDDPDVGAAALYLESFHDPRTFSRLAASFSRTRPLLVVFGGSSAAGHRAGLSHTAAHATPSRALQALYRAAGVIAAEDLQDLVDTAALLTEQPLPQGSRLGVLSNAGGLGILAADAAQRRGVPIPTLSGPARAALEAVAPGASGVSNPVDLGAGAGPESFGRAAACLAGSGEVDALLVITASTAVTDTEGALDALEAAFEQAPGLPFLSVVVGSHADRPSASRRRATTFGSADTAVRSFAHAQQYAGWLRSAPERVRLRSEAVGAEDRAAASTASGEGRWLDAAQAERLLAPAGVRVAPYVVARTVRDVVDAVRRLGLPLTVKSADPALVHKTEARQVRTGLATRRAVADAVRSVREAAHDPHAPVLLQQQVIGPELAFGVTRDPTFGPLVMVASGGTSLDLWDDQTFLMPPLDPSDVAAALASLRTWPLLTGFRGGRTLDVDAVVGLVVRLGQWALEHPEVQELDLNPVMITDDGPVCVDAKVRARS